MRINRWKNIDIGCKVYVEQIRGAGGKQLREDVGEGIITKEHPDESSFNWRVEMIKTHRTWNVDEKDIRVIGGRVED